MKTSSGICSILLLMGCSAFAQNPGYEAAIKKGLAQGKASTTDAQLTDVSNYFERIASAEKTKWLPEYYAALYSYMGGAYKMANPKDAEPYFNKALTHIEQAKKINPNESEVLALKGQINYMEMAIDPQSRYMTYLPMSKAEIDSAATLNPANPRVDYFKGIQSFYTPEQYGGGKAVAQPLLEKAISKYQAFKPADDISPSWGIENCQKMLDQCKQK